MDINDIYEATRTRGLTRSRRQFSIEFLRMAPNYAADTGLARCGGVAEVVEKRGGVVSGLFNEP